mgnify:FL=1
MKRFFKYPLLIIVAEFAVTVFFAVQMRNLTISNGIRMFFPQENESYTRLVESEDKFGATDKIGIVLETPDSPFLTDRNIKLVQMITKKLEALKNVDEVQSLSNVDYLSGENGGLASEPLIGSDYTGSAGDIQRIYERLSDWSDVYDRVIMSDDMHSTQMVVTLVAGLPNNEIDETLAAVKNVVTSSVDRPDIKTTFVGDPVVSAEAKRLMNKDLAMLIPLVTIVVLITLFLSFRTMDGMLLPIITVLMATCWALGLLAMNHFTFNIISTLIPIALIAVGAAYGIHVMNHYYAQLDEWYTQHPGETVTKEIHKDIICTGVKSVFFPVLLAGLTTIAGFLSNITSPLIPMRSFSIFTSSGVFFALLLALTFIPALMMLKPVNKIGRKAKLPSNKNTSRNRSGSFKQKDSSATFYRIYHFLAGSKVRLLLFCVLMAGFSYFGIRKIVIDTAMVNYFPENGKMRQDIRYVDKRFAGTDSIYFIVSGGEKGSMNDPEILEPLDELETYLQKKYDSVGKVISFTTFVKRMNQVMHIPADTVPEEIQSEAADTTAGGTSSNETLDSFDSFSFVSDSEETPDTAAPAADYTDPAAVYTGKLAETMTVKKGLDMLASAYAEAGGKHASVDEIVDVLEKKLNYNGTAFYEIPRDTEKYGVASREDLKNLITQYLLLYSGSLNSFADNSLEPSTLRVIVQLRTRSTTLVGDIINDAKTYAAVHFPKGYTLEATGGAQLEYVMTGMIISSQLYSLLFSFVCVFVILTIAFKSPIAGIIGCIPLVFCVLINFMVMGLTHINLDMFTALIASLAVGIGIDYTIHFITNYKEEREESDDLEEVTRKTFRKSGRGIIINAVAVGLGFVVLCLSEFVVLRYIGILVAVVMFTSSALAMTVIPGILNNFDPKFIRPKTEKK